MTILWRKCPKIAKKSIFWSKMFFSRKMKVLTIVHNWRYSEIILRFRRDSNLGILLTYNLVLCQKCTISYWKFDCRNSTVYSKMAVSRNALCQKSATRGNFLNRVFWYRINEHQILWFREILRWGWSKKSGLALAV